MLIDVNASYGPWPFAPLGCETPDALEQHLAAHNIEVALTSPLRAIFYEDTHPANLEALRKAENSRRLRVVPTLNPTLADCLDNLEIYRSAFAIPGVKLYPNYHNISLSSSRCLPLVDYLSNEGIPLLLNFRLEDERHLHHALKLKTVRISQVGRLAKRFPKLKLVCLGLYRDELKELCSEHKRILADLSFADWHHLIPDLLKSVRPEQLLFGSHTPLMVTEANRYKLETAAIPESTRQQIAFQNAQAFFELSL